MPVVLFAAFVFTASQDGIGQTAPASPTPSDSPARSESLARAVRLSSVVGSVQILRGDQTQFEQAYQNMPLVEGSRLVTSNDGRAEIEFEDGAVARLTPNSSLNIDQLRRNSSGSTVNQLEVLSGLAYFEVGADKTQQYSILFGSNTVTPNGTSTFRVNLDNSPPEVVVLEGGVQVASSAYSVGVRRGETVKMGDSRYYLVSEIVPDSWDQWNIDRDRVLASMAAVQTPLNGVDPNEPGWSDLDRYGEWYAVADYGTVWAPHGVDVNWDPFGSGSWAYYPGAGYVWVSANPWGWLPYHCGNWTYFDGFGWAWVPGLCNAQWFTDVGIWNAPGYYVRPQKPHPVGPRDNLPQHTIIIVRRGKPVRDPRGTQPGLVASAAPRKLVVGGREIAPLPKTIAASNSGQRPVGIAGPTSPAYALPESARGLRTFSQNADERGADLRPVKTTDEKTSSDAGAAASTAVSPETAASSAVASPGTTASFTAPGDGPDNELMQEEIEGDLIRQSATNRPVYQGFGYTGWGYAGVAYSGSAAASLGGSSGSAAYGSRIGSPAGGRLAAPGYAGYGSAPLRSSPVAAPRSSISSSSGGHSSGGGSYSAPSSSHSSSPAPSSSSSSGRAK